MRWRILNLVPLLFLGAFPAAAQNILPNSFAAWSANGQEPFSPGASAPILNRASADAARDAMAVANEYEFLAGERVAYQHGAETLDVTLYRMKDPSGAYGEYSYLRSVDMRHADLAEHSSMSRERALVLVGNVVLDIRGSDLPGHEQDLHSLVSAVTPHAQQGVLPTLWQHLPQKDMIERTDHYVLGPVTLNEFIPVSNGDWLGFSDEAEAEFAKYRIDGHEVTLLLADFPTPQLATRRLAQFQTIFNLNGAGSDSKLPLVFAKRSLTLLGITFGARSQAEADKLLNEVQSGTVLTWNEPSFEVTEPGIATILVGTFIGTGIICLFAMISSLAFGGARLIIKRALPNKVFDRSSELQILQLGLSSKPINAEDFYGPN